VFSLSVRLRWVVFREGMLDLRVLICSSIEASCSGERVSAASCLVFSKGCW
jgi:hypothetical protein